jgi:uncharacterized repeat protein (TIGR01451 family)/fimbrial isopeptide formation D2 family protein
LIQAAIAGVLLLAVAAVPARAQTPSIAVSGLPATPLIGEQACIGVDFSNSGGPTGYGPYVIGVYDENITVTSVSFIDVTPVIELIGVFDASMTLQDPISGQPIMGPENGSAYLVRYPIGSVDAGNAPLALEVCGTVGVDAEVGVPLIVDVIPGFEFGNTPTGAAGPILNVDDTVSSTVTPQLARVEKTNTAPENERPPGPSHAFQYNYRVDVSQLVLIGDVELRDVLPGSIQWTGVDPVITAPLGVGCTASVLPSAPPTPGGELVVECTEVVGTAGTGDLFVTLPVYVTDILDESADNPQAISNTVNLAYDYQGTGYTDSDTSDLLAQHAAVQKAVAGTPLPGNKLTYTINFQLTDYSTGANAFIISDLLPDGLAFDATVSLAINGVLTPVTPTVSPGPAPGQTSLIWDVAAANGGAIPAGARGQLRYQATILDRYSNGVTPVQAADVLANGAALDFGLDEGAPGSDDTGAPATIRPNTPIKAVVDPDPLPAQLSPGQEVTFRLSLEIPAGSTSAVALTDLLPRPVFDVADFDAATDFTVLPPFQSLAPSVSTAASDNSVTFDFGDISGTNPETLAVDLRARITSQPFADDLFLTNLLSSSYENAAGDRFEGIRAVGITVGAPELVITKGVIAVANPRARITPAPPADPSLELADSDASGADAFDVVTYLVTVENVGGQAAFAVTVFEELIPGQRCDDSPTVVDGNGTPLSVSGNINTGGGLRLRAPLPGNDGSPPGGGAPFGADTALITLNCVLDSNVTPGETLTSKTSVGWQSVDGSSAPFPARDDEASVVIDLPELTKTVIDVQPGYAGRPDRVHIGELVTYRLDIRVPEGVSPAAQLDDLLDTGLAHVDVLSISASSGDLISSEGGFNDAVRANAGFTAQGSGAAAVDRRLLIGPGPADNGFGTLTNGNQNNAVDEIVSVVYRARVLNDVSNLRGDSRNNRARWSWQPDGTGRQTQQVSAANVRIIEPDLRVTRTFLPSAGDESSPPQVRITVEHSGASNADTFDVSLVEVLPTVMRVAGGGAGVTLTNCPAPDDLQVLSALGDRLRIDWSDFPENNGVCVIEFQTGFNFLGSIAGQLLEGCTEVTYQSLASRDQPLPATPNGNLLAAERTGNVSDPGGGANTYRDESCDQFQVFDVGAFKRVTATSEPQTDNIPGTPRGAESLTIGEEVTFRVVVALPDSLVTGLVVTDLSPNGSAILEILGSDIPFVGGDLIYAGSGQPVANNLPIPDFDPASPYSLAWDFGAIGNIDKTVDNGVTREDQIVFEVVAKVRDLPGNGNNDIDANTVFLSYGPDGSVTDEAVVEIVEPLLRVVKSADLTEVEAGETITYTVRVEHNSGSRVAAQQATVSDSLPPELTLVPGSVRLGGLCTLNPDAGPTETADGFSASWTSFDLGAICEIQMQAQVDISAVTGQRIINEAMLTWTSLSSTGDPDDRPYDAAGSWEVLVSPPGLDKELIATDQGATRFVFATPSSGLTIGETATFELTAEFPDGTTRLVTVEERLPVNDVALEITRSVVKSIGADLVPLGSGLAVGEPGLPCAVPLASCTRWLLGTVINQPDARPGTDPDDSVVFEVDAIVLDDPLNSGAPGEDKGLLNELRLLSPDAQLLATEPFDIVEPQLSIEKFVVQSTPPGRPEVGITKAGAKERFVLRIAHMPESTATARNIRVVDELDLNMLGQDPAAPDFEAFSTTCPGLVLPDSEPATGSSVPDFEFRFDALTLELGACEIAYSIDMSSSLPVPGEFENTVTLGWESAPGSAESRTYERKDSVRLISFNDASVIKAVRSTSLPETGKGAGDGDLEDLAIGEIVEYEIVATFAEGRTTDGALASDLFQDDANGVLEFVDGSIDFIGANLSFTGSGLVIDPTANPLEIPYGSVTNAADGVLDENDTIRYTLRLRVAVAPENADDGALPLQRLDNTATIDFTGLTGTRSDTVQIEVVEPDVELTKRFTAVQDGVASVELTVSNSGNAPAYDIVATDVFDEDIWVPGSLVPVRVPAAFELVESSDGSATTVTLRVADPSLPPDSGEFLAPGQSETVQFTMALRNNGQPLDALGDPVTSVPNTATLVSSSLPGDLPDQDDPEPQERSYSVDATDTLLLPALTFEKTWTAPSSPAQPGQRVTYTISIANTGAAPLTGVVLTDTPDMVRGEFQVGTVTVNAGGNSDAGTVVSGNGSGDDTIEVSFAQVDAAGAVTVSYDVRVPFPYPDGQTASQRLVNQAELATNELPDRLSDDPGTAAPDDETVVPIDADPVMIIRKTDNGAVGTGGSFVTYELTVGNAGNQDATGVEVTETVPANTTFVPSLSTRTWRCTDITPGSTCVYPLFGVPVGSSRTLQFVVRVDAPLAAGVTSITNTASVAEDGVENPDNPNPPLVPGPPSEATDSDTTPIVALPILSVLKDDGGISVAPGDRYVYRIEYENLGNQVATNVVLTETVPDYVVFDAATSTPGWSCPDGSPTTTLCIFDLGSVTPGAPGFVDFGLRVNFPAQAGAELIGNTVEINDDGSNSAGIVLRDDATDATPLIAVPDLVIGKSSDAGTVRVNQVVTYALSYDNVGNQNATGVVVSEFVPEGSRYLETESAPTLWSCADGSPAGTICQSVIGNLVAGSGGALRFAVEVVSQNQSLELVNVAQTNDDGSNGLDPTPANNITRLVDRFPIPSIPALSAMLLVFLSLWVAVLGLRALRAERSSR